MGQREVQEKDSRVTYVVMTDSHCTTNQHNIVNKKPPIKINKLIFLKLCHIYLPGGNVEPQKYTPYKDTFIIVVKIIDYINEHGRYYVKWTKPDSKSNTACFH